MNNYVDFTNLKSIVNPPSLLTNWCARCNNINEKMQELRKKNFVLLEPEKKSKRAPASQHCIQVRVFREDKLKSDIKFNVDGRN